MPTKKKVTPLMMQYNKIKAKYPDALLLFRVGDFYETFGKDAVKAAGILDIVLTKRNNGDANDELAGFPHHALNTYMPKLVKAGYRVAICDQLEDPKTTKTIVKRGVTELVTPGVRLNDDVLQSKSNNFLAAIHYNDDILGIAFLDISTGEFLTSEGSITHIDRLLQNFSPSETLISKKDKKILQGLLPELPHVFHLEDWVFKSGYSQELLPGHFKTNSLKGFGVESLKNGCIAAGAILHYLKETHHSKLEHIASISAIPVDEYVCMDRFTVRNLDIYPSSSQSCSLLQILDMTQSPMGGRLLKRWMAMPLKDVERIERRHNVVQYFCEHPDLLESLRGRLKAIYDIERLCSKVATGRANPRELNHLKNSLSEIEIIKDSFTALKNPHLKKLGDNLNSQKTLQKLLSDTLHSEAPVLVQKGNVIAKGYNKTLDELRDLLHSGKYHLKKLLDKAIEHTGITSLKIDMNNVFGYYIEVRNTHKDKVPEDWIRKQTLANSERYVTEELKVYENRIFGAEEQITTIENRLYAELLKEIARYIPELKKTALTLATIDCLGNFSKVSLLNQYTRPNINTSNVLNIKGGRHPIIEQQLPPDKPYIANDIYLNPDTRQIIIITGPNMSGKSAILRQVALIVSMAQMGCFVPVDKADIGLVDRIFTRVGAGDNITGGESTFMVEMNETASILNNISEKSLILLDEIGRGTSTYDGISIAWSITDYLHNHPYRPKTLFATHYHELNEIANQCERVDNFNVSIKQTDRQILFLRKLQPGGSEHSFGIHVAKMAGMPHPVLQKARSILKKLESTRQNDNIKTQLKTAQQDIQLRLFSMDDPKMENIKNELLELDANSLTPLEALMKISEWKRAVDIE